MAPHMRPRPSSIDLLPEECEGIVAWAFQELANTPRAQTEVYAEFRQKLIALQGELGIDFDIPHFSSFNRHNLRLGKLTNKMQRTQAIANAVVSGTNGADADKLTQASTRMLKTLLVEVMENAVDDGMSFKEAKDAATALRQLALAETASTGQRQKLEAEDKLRRVESDMKANAEKALDTLSSEPGISKEAIARARLEFLGVRPKKKDGA
ncbi:phage protein [Rhizobium sp. PDO1-076]|uniref:phage protein Gp27 family protein n=1 Tax=Rhizobium sp. PDO1-076 TaxID=1125979 RepID=UPI00024E35C9|nr:phage protein Gp27 family protein [Rhizobium sp. PDO1-076]EHS51505.1 phage protein [Rhizobium sp. PDO1-076]